MKREKRRHRRKSLPGPLRYSHADTASTPGSKLSDLGVILNVSESGICFFTDCPFEVGASLVIECPTISGSPSIGTVRWCKKTAKDLYRVGLMTDGSHPPEPAG